MSLSTQEIETLLALAINYVPKISSNDVLQSHDSCFYPFQIVTSTFLLEDCTRYVEMHTVPHAKRRVCFLFATEQHATFIVLLQVSNINQNVWLQIKKQKSGNLPIDLISQLYAKVEIRCVTSSKVNQSLIKEKLIKAIQNTYKSSTVSFQILSDNQDVNFSLALIESSLQFLHQGNIGVIDIQKALRCYSQLCVNQLRQRMEILQKNSSASYKEVKKYFKVLLKYNALRLYRRYGERDDLTLEQLEIFQESYHHKKKAIYRFPIITIEEYFQYLSLKTLLNLLNCKQNSDLQNYLTTECNKQFDEMQQWERNFLHRLTMLKRNIKVNLFSLSKKIFQSFYVNSFIGLGAELLQWSGEKIYGALNYLAVKTYFSQFAVTGLGNQRGQFIVNYLIKSMSLFTNGCKQFSHRIHPALGNFFKHITMENALKVVGGGIGLWATYALGSYQLVRMFVISTLALQIKNSLERRTLNDRKAKYKANDKFLSTTSVGLAVTSVALGEYYGYTQDYRRIVLALAGFTGGIASSTVGRYFMRDKKEDMHASFQPNEQATLSTFFISMLGCHSTQLLAMLLLTGYEKQTIRYLIQDKFCSAVKRENFQGCVVDFAENTQWSPGFWFNSGDQMYLGYTTDRGFYSTECEIIEINAQEKLFFCDVLDRSLLSINQ